MVVGETRLTRATGPHDVALVERERLLGRRKLLVVAEQLFLALLDRVGRGIARPSGRDGLVLACIKIVNGVVTVAIRRCRDCNYTHVLLSRD